MCWSLVARCTSPGIGVALDDVKDVSRIEEFDGATTLAKVDFTAVDAGELPAIARTGNVQGLEMLAERIETAEDLSLAEGYGFDFFQGYYLSRPESMERQILPGLTPAHARLLEVVNERELDTGKVTKAVESDPSLTYKLLRSANSAAFAQQRQIRSVHEAVVLFGENEIRRTAMFVVLGGNPR